MDKSIIYIVKTFNGMRTVSGNLDSLLLGQNLSQNICRIFAHARAVYTRAQSQSGQPLPLPLPLPIPIPISSTPQHMPENMQAPAQRTHKRKIDETERYFWGEVRHARLPPG